MLFVAMRILKMLNNKWFLVHSDHRVVFVHVPVFFLYSCSQDRNAAKGYVAQHQLFDQVILQ